MENFIRVYEKAYTPEYCDKTIEAWNTIGQSGEEKENHDWSKVSFRRDKAVFMNVADKEEHLELKTDICEEFFDTLLGYVDIYLKDIGIWEGVSLVPDSMKVQKYSHTRSGGYYAFHSEQDGRTNSDLRRHLTYTMYLNDVPEGEGETEFLYQGFRYQPKKGDLVIFPAFFTHTHRGNPVYTTDKYIATGWMLWSEENQEEVVST